MSEIKLNNGRIIGDFLKPYIIAELNTSHFGKLDVAKEMILAAKDAGCDCVKFQSWSAESLYSDEYYQENKIAKRFVTKFSLSPDELFLLSEVINISPIEIPVVYVHENKSNVNVIKDSVKMFTDLMNIYKTYKTTK